MRLDKFEHRPTQAALFPLLNMRLTDQVLTEINNRTDHERMPEVVVLRSPTDPSVLLILTELARDLYDNRVKACDSDDRKLELLYIVERLSPIELKATRVVERLWM